MVRDVVILETTDGSIEVLLKHPMTLTYIHWCGNEGSSNEDIYTVIVEIYICLLNNQNVTN